MTVNDGVKQVLAWWLLCAVMAVVVFGAGACRMPEATPNLPQQNMTNFGDITRFHDTQAGVVCWVWDTGTVGGISCLPIDQTELGEK